MKKLLSISRLMVLFACVAGASADMAKTTADAVIDRYIEVSGGVKAIEKLKTMEGTLLMNMPNAGMTLQMKIASQHPNLMCVEQIIPGVGEMKQGYNGTIGWSSDPIQGNREMMPGEVKELIKEASPQWILQIKDRFQIRSVGDETGSEVTLHLQESSDRPIEKWVFSKKTGYLIVQDRVADMGPSGKLPIKTTFSDYRIIEGMAVPHKTSAANPAFSFTLEVQSLEFNTSLDPSIFEPPF